MMPRPHLLGIFYLPGKPEIQMTVIGARSCPYSSKPIPAAFRDSSRLPPCDPFRPRETRLPRSLVRIPEVDES